MIILSLPYCRNWKEIVKDSDPNGIVEKTELRFDLGNVPLDSVHGCFDDTCILTVRGNVENKRRFIDYHIENSKCQFDLDHSIVGEFNIPAERLIVSYHDFSTVPDIIALKQFLSRYSETSFCFIKTAINIPDFKSLINVQEVLNDFSGKLIFVGMGKLGKLARIMYKQFGSEAVYTGIQGRETAEGQITLNELYMYYPVDAKTEIGGIIGGEQVQDSLGIDFYNAEFRKRKLNARYLPFVIDNPEDFVDWLKNRTCRINFYGFSITMPAKKTIPKLLSFEGVANLMLWKSGRFLNTDLDAFIRIREHIEKLPDLPIVIYGYGASAENAVKVLAGYHLMVCGRNQVKIQSFCNKHSLPVFNPDTVDRYIFINCTPMKLESLFDEFQGIEYLFNLNYPTVISKDRRLVFTGEDFWKYQAERQLEEFLNEINSDKGLK